MCIYCNTSNYRKIYEHHYGKILKDADGRSFEIHHIDGNHLNNQPSNLIAVSIQEHYNIHFSNGDFAACLLISTRMNISHIEKSELSKKLMNIRIQNNTWHFNSDNAKIWSEQRKLAGLNYWQSDVHAENCRIRQNQKVIDGTHSFVGKNNPVHERIKLGIHHTLGPSHNQILLASGKHASQKSKKCPHCNTVMDSANYAKHHGDNCYKVKEKTPLSNNPLYINSQAKHWKIVNTETGGSEIIIGLRSWTKMNNFNYNTVSWSVRKYKKYKQYLIEQL